MNKVIILRIILIFIVVVFAQHFISENLNGFPYGGAIQKRYQNPYPIAVMANFDGVHYANIAFEGYREFEQAFFPLYPVLIRSVGTYMNNNHVLAGVFISFVSLFIACNLLLKVLREYYGDIKAFFAVILILAFPTAFYFQAVYTESLFFALCATTIYFLHEKKPNKAAMVAALSSLARIQGVFLVFFFIFYFYNPKRTLVQNISLLFKKHFLYLLSPFVGLGIYMLYLYITKHDALYFFSAQPTFGANRSTSIILLPQVYFRYIKIFLTASHNFQFFVAVVEFIFFNVSFILSGYVGYRGFKNKNWFEVSLSLFSLAYIILPSLTGTFSSIPRYSLLALAQYIGLLNIKRKKYQVVLVVIFSILQVILLSLFSRGYFIS
jgi:hypothetical protein